MSIFDFSKARSDISNLAGGINLALDFDPKYGAYKQTGRANLPYLPRDRAGTGALPADTSGVGSTAEEINKPAIDAMQQASSAARSGVASGCQLA